MSFLPGSWRAWINRSAAGPFLNADSLNDWEMKFRALDCLGAVRALGLVDALPGSPADGDAYLTSAAATPANKIVRRFGDVWESFTPPNGMVAWLPDGSAKQFLSGSWGDASFGGGGGAVSSVFGRTGAVTAQTGDYTPAQVGAAAASHTHAAGDVTSGTFAEARIPALPQSRITGLETALAGKSDTGHTHAYIPTSLKGAANGVAELGADGKVPSAQLPASSSPIVSVAKTMEFALANEATSSPVQILTVPVPVGFFTTNGMIELDLDLDFLYFAAGNRIILSFEVGASLMWSEWNDDIPADAPRVFHGYIGKYKAESGETFVRMAGTLNGVRISGEYHDVTSTVAGQTSFNVSAHVVIEGVGAHVNCAVGKVFA